MCSKERLGQVSSPVRLNDRCGMDSTPPCGTISNISPLSCTSLYHTTKTEGILQTTDDGDQQENLSLSLCGVEMRTTDSLLRWTNACSTSHTLIHTHTYTQHKA